MEYEVARTLAIAISQSVRLENAPAEATGQAGGADEEAETTEQRLPRQQVRRAAKRPQQRLVEVAEREQARDGEQDAARVDVRDRREPPSARRVVEDARIDEAVATAGVLLGFFPPVTNKGTSAGRLQGLVLAPSDLSSYKEILVSRESSSTPKQPTAIVLQGKIIADWFTGRFSAPTARKMTGSGATRTSAR